MLYTPDLEKYRNRNDNYRVNNITYHLKICKTCGEKCLCIKDSIYCSKKCVKRVLTIEHKRKISETRKRKKLSENKNNSNWKGGVTKNNIPIYKTFVHQLEPIEQCRCTQEGFLEVKCAYCDRWFVPNRSTIKHRIESINGKNSGEHRLYCSPSCKSNCPIYRQRIYPKSYKSSSSREVQSELRKLVFQRDNWTCIKCGSNTNLHCHHIEGLNQNPIESCDIDMCVTLCKYCHKKVHKQKDCKYSDLQYI